MENGAGIGYKTHEWCGWCHSWPPFWPVSLLVAEPGRFYFYFGFIFAFFTFFFLLALKFLAATTLAHLREQ